MLLERSISQSSSTDSVTARSDSSDAEDYGMHRRRSRRRRTHLVAPGVARFFNNVLSAVGSSFAILLLYLNYMMFETYIGEFLFAFIFGEAFWDTKTTMVTWLGKVNSLSLTSNQEFSLRNEMLFMFRHWLSAFSLQKLLDLNRDSSHVYIQTGLVVVTTVVKPEFAYFVFTIMAGIVIAVMFLNNKLLFLFRMHYYLGLNDDTLVALLLVGGMVGLSVFLTGTFILFISRDVKLLSSELANFISNKFEDNESWGRDLMKESMIILNGFLRDNIEQLEGALDNSTGWGRFASRSLQIVYGLTMEESPSTSVSFMRDSVCFTEFTLTMDGMRQFWTCFQDDLSSLSFTPLLEPMKGVLHQTSSLVLMTSTLSVLLLDMGFRLIFFLTILIIILSSKDTILQSLTSFKSETNSKQEQGDSLIIMFENEVQRAMEAVVILPMKMSILNSLATLAVLALFDIQARYLCACLVFLVSLFPLFPPFVIILPWLVFYVAAYGHSYGWGIFVMMVNYAAYYIVTSWALIGFNARTTKSRRQSVNASVETESQEELGEELPPGKREYVASLSMFFGLVTFGPKGIVIGPFLFCLVTIMHKIYVRYQAIVSEARGNINYDVTEPVLHEESIEESTPRAATPVRRARTDSLSLQTVEREGHSLKKVKSDDDLGSVQNNLFPSIQSTNSTNPPAGPKVTIFDMSLTSSPTAQSLRRSQSAAYLPQQAQPKDRLQGMADKLAKIAGINEKKRSPFAKGRKESQERIGVIDEIKTKQPKKTKMAKMLEEMDSLSTMLEKSHITPEQYERLKAQVVSRYWA